MGMAGDAPWAMAIMWTLCGLVFFFLCLRVYTRIVCLASYGIDDHVYAVAFVFLLIFTIFTQLSAEIGFGQTLEQIGSNEAATRATLYECIGQGFAIIGMAIAKASLGFFLLRLVHVKWHKIAIWSAMALVMAASIAQVLCFWLSCVPLPYVYDKYIPGGECPIDTRPTSYILCVSTILVDFFFAFFPWLILWDLHMPKREKYTIACSMSLGVIAAAAGIKRTTEVAGLYTPNYLHDSVGLIVWSSAEMAVTLICIGIPVCLPLFKRMRGGVQRKYTSAGYLRKAEEGQHDSSLALRTIGGGYAKKDGQPVSGSNKSRDGSVNLDNVKFGTKGTTTRVVVGRVSKTSSGGNTSDEDILGDEYRQSASQTGEANQSADERLRHPGIMVTKSYRVEN